MQAGKQGKTGSLIANSCLPDFGRMSKSYTEPNSHQLILTYPASLVLTSMDIIS